MYLGTRRLVSAAFAEREQVPFTVMMRGMMVRTISIMVLIACM